MAITRSLFSSTLLAALTLLAPNRTAARLPADFTLGPGGKITISTDKDSTSAGCLNTDSSECDSYSITIPFTIGGSGDLSTDLNGASGSLNLDLYETTSQPCAPGNLIFEATISVSLLKHRQTKTLESEKFTGIVHSESIKGVVMVPTSFTLKTSRKTGVGTLTMRGLGQDLGALSGATVDVGISIHDFADDSDDDFSCATVPATFKTSP
jgi:hypothetical protein